MNHHNKMKVFLIVALVMLANSMIFLILGLTIASFAFFGITITCFSIGIAFSIVGLKRHLKDMKS